MSVKMTASDGKKCEKTSKLHKIAMKPNNLRYMMNLEESINENQNVIITSVYRFFSAPILV